MAVILESGGVTVVEATDAFSTNDPWGRSALRWGQSISRLMPGSEGDVDP
jgi:hypothetical protein